MNLSKKEVFWVWLIIGIMSTILIIKAILNRDFIGIVIQVFILFMSVYSVLLNYKYR